MLGRLDNQSDVDSPVARARSRAADSHRGGAVKRSVQPMIDESMFKRNKMTTLAADVGR